MARDRVKTPEQRRVRKQTITFNIELTQEQKDAKAIALQNVITIFTGKPGTSKTILNCQIALDLVMSQKLGKILITRPTVVASEGEGMGFLPGDAFDFVGGKMGPYIAPILQAMYKLRSKKDIEDLIKAEKIEIAPIDFVRGRNFEDCVVIVDEAQNLTYGELKALVTRICDGAMMLFTSDLGQVDLLDKSKSAGRLFELISKREGVALVELKEQFRHPLAVQLNDDIEAAEKEVALVRKQEKDARFAFKNSMTVVPEVENVNQLSMALEDPTAPWNFIKKTTHK